MVAEPDVSDGAAYALGLVRTICTTVGPGLPGSAQERERADAIRDELAAHLGDGNVATEDFDFAPGAFVGSVPLAALLVLAAALANVLGGGATWSVIAALALSALAIAVYVLEFVLERELLDRWFPKARSQNVIGTLPARTAARRVLIVSGHHDSAPENRWLGWLGYGFFVGSLIAALGFAVMLVASVMQVVGLATGDPELGRLGWHWLVFPIAPAVGFGLFFTRSRRHGGTVLGAADNLAASALVAALCRFFVEHRALVPSDVELRFLSFGAEEAGLRGSRRYVARHLDELRRLDARLLNFETIADREIGILTSDLAGSVRCAPEAVQAAVTAAERAGVPHRVKSAFVGVGTDAAPFCRERLRAVSLLPFRVPQQMIAFYHQPADRPEVLDPGALANVFALAAAWIEAGGQGTTTVS